MQLTTEMQFQASQSNLKSDPMRFTVKCAYEICKLRLHASLMRKSTLCQVLYFCFSLFSGIAFSVLISLFFWFVSD